MRQLAKQHGHKLLPTAEAFGIALGLMVLDRTSELPRENSCKSCEYTLHT